VTISKLFFFSLLKMWRFNFFTTCSCLKQNASSKWIWFKETEVLHSVRRSRIPTSNSIITKLKFQQKPFKASLPTKSCSKSLGTLGDLKLLSFSQRSK
jgi:hypothetical protein